MKNWTLILLALVVLSSCADDKEEKGELTLRFLAQWEGEPLVLNTQEVWYWGKETMIFSNLNMFLSDLSITDEDNSEVMLSDISFIDFQTSNRDSISASEGVTMTFELDEGVYDNLSIGVGVSSDLNAKLPSDFESTHPLSQFGSHWTAWNSFIFSKTEGMIDSDGDDKADKGFAYHIGSDQMYRTLTLPNVPIEVIGDQTKEIIISVDYKKVFGSASDYIDILQYPTFHNPQDPTLAELTEDLANNFAGAFSVRIQ